MELTNNESSGMKWYYWNMNNDQYEYRIQHP
jgi:hypothetical protein